MNINDKEKEFEKLIEDLYALFDEITHVTIEGLKADYAEQGRCKDWKECAAEGMQLIEDYRK